MFAIEVEFLTGRSVATDRELRSEPEWPPHPQRLFAALVAAYKEMDFGSEERAALKWVEQLGAPQISASVTSIRTCVEHFVPINDDGKKQFKKDQGKLKFFPQIDSGIAVRRFRAPERFFPTVVPEEPLVQYIWPEAADDRVSEHRDALSRVVSAMSYLGHSTSLVRAALVDNPKDPTLVPVDGNRRADHRLRTFANGRLKLLEQTYNQSLECERRIEAPDVPRTGYVEPATARIPRPVFGRGHDWFVFERTGGRPLPLSASLALTNSVRQAVCHHCDDSIAGLLCGHKSDGSPEDRAHVAYVPLAHVGHRHADGEIHGFAVVLPDELSSSDRLAVLSGLAELREIWNGDASDSNRHLAFNWTVQPVKADVRKKTLQSHTWTRPARCWATVTPMVFGHFLRKLDDARTHRIVSECCTAIGLPEPRHVRVSTTPLHEGVPISGAFPSLTVHGKPVWTTFQKGRHRLPKNLPDGTPVRMRYHVAVEFDGEVYGPVILGAGRYFGMGFCRPLFG